MLTDGRTDGCTDGRTNGRVHLQGKQFCHFHCCLQYKLGSCHKGKILLPSESSAHIEKILSTSLTNRKSRKLSPFENMTEKVGGVPRLFKSSFLSSFLACWAN